MCICVRCLNTYWGVCSVYVKIWRYFLFPLRPVHFLLSLHMDNDTLYYFLSKAINTQYQINPKCMARSISDNQSCWTLSVPSTSSSRPYQLNFQINYIWENNTWSCIFSDSVQSASWGPFISSPPFALFSFICHRTTWKLYVNVAGSESTFIPFPFHKLNEISVCLGLANIHLEKVNLCVWLDTGVCVFWSPRNTRNLHIASWFQLGKVGMSEQNGIWKEGNTIENHCTPPLLFAHHSPFTLRSSSSPIMEVKQLQR